MPMNLLAKHRAAARRARRAAARAATLAGAVAAAVLCGGLAAPEARAGDAFEGDFVNNTLQMLGLKEEEKPEIEYRERAPLVVPPSSGLGQLPAPEAAPHASNPNWPKDPDVERRRQEAAKANAPVVRDDPGRPLMPSELNKGRRKTYVYSSDAKVESDPNPLSPSKLGFKGWFASGDDKDKITFNGEPQRESLVQPPPGYQTPAPNAPYGVIEPKKDEPFKFPTLFNRDEQK